MATRDYFAQFGSGNPASNTGLAPTFIAFITTSGAAGTPPTITEPGSKGLYKWSYDASATLIAFVLDGATTGLATSDRYISGVLDPYDTFGVTLNAIGVTLVAQGSTLVGMGTTMIAQGSTVVAIGNSLTNQGSTLVAIGNTAIATEIAQGVTIIAMGATLVGYGTSLAALATLVGTTTDLVGNSSVDPTSVFAFLKRAQEIGEGNETYVKATGALTMYSRGSTLLATKAIADNSTQTTKT